MAKTAIAAKSKNQAADAVGAPTYSDAQLVLAARLYYIDGVLQNQIAKMVGVSQAKVSRMLAVARDRGLVRITVPDYEPRDASLERALCDRFRLQAAVVVRALADQSAAERRHAVGYFAAPAVSPWIAPKTTLAVAGGRTLECLTESMNPQGRAAGVTVVQAMGNVGAAPGPYDASEIGRTIAQRWRAAYLALNTPAFLPTAAMCRQLMAIKEVRDVFDRLAHAEMAMVGVGDLESSVFIERGVLASKDIEQLRRAGAVGEILGRFYNARGKECDTPFARRVISLNLAQLRRIPNVVAVVAGEDRGEAIGGAIRGGIIKGLVIDSAAAERLLSLFPRR